VHLRDLLIADLQFPGSYFTSQLHADQRVGVGVTQPHRLKEIHPTKQNLRSNTVYRSPGKKIAKGIGEKAFEPGERNNETEQSNQKRCNENTTDDNGPARFPAGPGDS
jgi:hypothetical protein